MKDIPLGIGDPRKETKNMLEKKNDKQVRTNIGGTLKDKEVPRDKKDKRVCTHAGVVYIEIFSNEIEK